MRFTDTLPPPSAEALSHSEQLTALIRQQIHDHGGWLSFHDFMHYALYAPSLGYYVAGLRKIGADGDFITAPELSPLFSQCIAQQCAQVLADLPNASILELGAGSGLMAVQILLHLERLNCLTEYYFILDLSPDLQIRQRDNLEHYAPHLLAKVQWLQHLPQQAFNGVILGNEVLDAMPVELFQIDEHGLHRVSVELKDDALALGLKLAPFVEQIQPRLASNYPLPYTSEFNPALSAWVHSLAEVLDNGLLLLIDYGYEQADYYHADRQQGTLLCHYQHRVHANPLLYPGLQDITASVDFTALAQAGTEAGLVLAGYSTQASFLINSGLENLFIEQLNANPEQQYLLAQQVRTLTLPSEMGERFKVMAFTKGFTSPLLGFRLGDRQHRL